MAVAGLGMVVWLAADIVYAGVLAAVPYKSGSWLDAVWLAAMVMVAVGFAGHRVPTPQVLEPPEAHHAVAARRVALALSAATAPAFVVFSALAGWAERAVLAAALVVAGLAVVLRVEVQIVRAAQVRRERDDAEARYEQMFEATSSPMLLVDPTSGRIVDANPAAVDLYGHDRATLRSMSVTQINTMSEAEVATEMDRARSSPRAPFEFRHRVASGEVIPVDVHSGPVTVDGRELLFSIVHDASERHAALEALQDSRARWRQLAELAEDMVYRATFHEGALVSLNYVNPAGGRILGVSVGSLLADPTLVNDHVHPDDSQRFLSIDSHTGTTNSTFRWQRPDGELVWLEDRRTTTNGRHDATTVVGVVRDVTAQHRTEQALRTALRKQEQVTDELHRVNRMKSTFLQAVSHELRTPLTSLLGFLAMLDDHGDVIDERQRALFLDRARANSERLQRLLDDLLDVNRLANGLVAPHQQTADLGTVLEHLVATMDLRDHEVALEVEDGRFTGDLVLVERALENLVGNAVRHTPPGTAIRVRVARDSSGDWLEATVEDDGPGLPGVITGHVFEPFTQGPQAHSDPSPGIGIGLTLTAQIAAIHDGTLTADNRPEGGARLHLRLHDRTAVRDRTAAADAPGPQQPGVRAAAAASDGPATRRSPRAP